MLKAITVGTVERERERQTERGAFLENTTSFRVALISREIINIVKIKNKDPCYGLRLLYLRI